MTKLKGDIFKDHSDKLGLLWTNDQWQTVMDAMDEYAQQEVKNIVVQSDVMRSAFDAGRERIKHPDWDFVYDNFDDYISTINYGSNFQQNI